jgi:raffinose/stachyose/melibiose transport system substrate-binding protein
MRKSILRAGALLGALLVAAPSLAQEISFWSWRQEDQPTYQKVIDAFEKENPGITVKFQAFVSDQYNTILSTALSGGTGPDVMMVRAHGALETVAKAGYLMPLDNAKVPGLDTLPKPALDAETSGGNIYAVPFAQQTMLILYNKDLFDKFGIQPPHTWDELMTAAKTLKDNGIFGFGNGTATAWQNETIVSALGSSIMGKGFYNDLMAGKVDFTDPRYVEALKKVKEASAYFPDGFQGLDYPSAQQLFASGLAGMFAGGSFEIANFKKLNPDINVGVVPTPVAKDGDEALVGLYFDGGYAGNAKTEHPEAVQKFLSYLTSKEFGSVFANELGNVSPIPGVEFTNPTLQEIAKLDEHSIPYIMLVHFRYQEPTGSVLLQAAVQKMLAGEQTPEEAAQAVTDGLATYYEPFQKLKK